LRALAKQSSLLHKKEWIASSRSLPSGAHSRDPLAPRNDGEHASAISPHVSREFCQRRSALFEKRARRYPKRGAGNAGRSMRPQPRVYW
jgi:hypothetical protein